MFRKFITPQIRSLLVMFCLFLVSCNNPDLLEQERNLRLEAESNYSFLSGLLITGVVVALLMGISMGTSAKNESDRQRKEKEDDETL